MPTTRRFADPRFEAVAETFAVNLANGSDLGAAYAFVMNRMA